MTKATMKRIFIVVVSKQSPLTDQEGVRIVVEGERAGARDPERDPVSIKPSIALSHASSLIASKVPEHNQSLQLRPRRNMIIDDHPKSA